MSKISLKHSGGKVVSLNSPTSEPNANDVAFKLPNADGSAGQVLKTDGSGNLSFGADTGGKILQVVQVAPFTGSGTDFTTTNTSAQDITALNTSITPTAAGSKLFVMMNIRTQNDYSSDINGRHTLNMRRSVAGGSDSGTLIQGFNGIFGYSGSSRNNYLNHAMTYLDTPSYSLGDAIVYKFSVASDTSNNYARIYLSSSSGPRSSITVFEIAA